MLLTGLTGHDHVLDVPRNMWSENTVPSFHLALFYTHVTKVYESKNLLPHLLGDYHPVSF